MTEYRIEILKYTAQNEFTLSYLMTNKNDLKKDLKYTHAKYQQMVNDGMYLRVVLQTQSRITYQKQLNVSRIIEEWATILNNEYLLTIDFNND